MTYIVGIKNTTFSGIISDTRVSFDTKFTIGSDFSLKSGYFFPGCIYGASGDVAGIRNFIIDCKLYLTGEDTLIGFWSEFVKFSEHYESSPSKSFQLILSSRNLGEPRLYLFDSFKNSLEEYSDFVSIGSGKCLLDSVINSKEKQENGNLFLIEKGYSAEAASYYCFYIYCLTLMQLAQGYEVDKLNSVGVGGYFHFIAQNSEMESSQNPAAYVLSKKYNTDEGVIFKSDIYRILFFKGALVIECPIKNIRQIILDSAAWPKCLNLSKNELDAFRIEADKFCANSNLYNFCGFGVIDPAQRRMFSCHITTINDHLFTLDGVFKPEFDRLVESNYNYL